MPQHLSRERTAMRHNSTFEHHPVLDRKCELFDSFVIGLQDHTVLICGGIIAEIVSQRLREREGGVVDQLLATITVNGPIPV